MDIIFRQLSRKRRSINTPHRGQHGRCFGHSVFAECRNALPCERRIVTIHVRRVDCGIVVQSLTEILFNVFIQTAAPVQGWITWSYLLFGLSGLIWAVVLVPIQLRQRVLLKNFKAVTPEYLRLSRVWQISGAIATVVPLPIVYLMITKGV